MKKIRDKKKKIQIESEERKSFFVENKKNSKTKRNSCFCIILLIAFIFENIIILIYFILSPKKEKLLVEKSNGSLRVLEREESLDSGLPFVKKCIDNILIDNKTYEKVENPRISAVIPCYNCAPFIRRAMRSIQNQDMKDIQIIIVDDKSNEETVNILNELEKEESRLEIYHNEKNMRILYTRSFGILRARGKYVVTLDQDDMFLDSDAFDALYIAAEDGNFDIISYRIFEAFDYYDRNRIKEHMFNWKKHNLKIYQPELSCYVVSTNGEPKGNDINIWGKLYRTSVYQSAINLIGEEEYKKPLKWAEDVIMLYIISNVASSYKYIRKYCLFHCVSRTSSSNFVNEDDKIYEELFKANMELNLSKKECYNVPAKYILNNVGYLKRVGNDLGKNMLKKVVKKIIHSEKIDDELKKGVENNFKEYLSG